MKDKTTRRGFFRALVRGAGLTGLGASAAWLLSRPGAAATSPCARCPALDGCSLPEGERTRRALGSAPTRRGEPTSPSRAPGTGTRGLCGALPKPLFDTTWTRREPT